VTKLVLVSHAHEEQALADALKVLLEGLTAGAVEVWFSSDPSAGGGMPLTAPWEEEVKKRLGEAKHVLAIQSPPTEGRPWILFECGYADGRGIGVTPITFRLAPSLPQPLGSFTGFRGDNREEIKAMCAKLLESFDLKLNDTAFNALIEPYLQQVALHAPRRALTKEVIDLWLQRFENLIRSGRTNELMSKRAEMYATLVPLSSLHPFKPSETTMTVHELLSRSLLDHKEYTASLEEANYALTVLNNDIEMKHRKALALVHLGNGQDALQIIRDIVSDNPYLEHNAELSSLEGRIYRERWLTSRQPNDLEQGFQAYNRAYQVDKTQYFPGINAASLALAKGDQASAEIIYREVLAYIAQPPEPVSFWLDFTIGEAHLGLGDSDEALAAYRRGTTRNPAPGLRARGSALAGVRRVLDYQGIADKAEPFVRLLAPEEFSASD
jgi:tetratricopeptide (TPR) repeat protein